MLQIPASSLTKKKENLIEQNGFKSFFQSDFEQNVIFSLLDVKSRQILSTIFK